MTIKMWHLRWATRVFDWATWAATCGALHWLTHVPFWILIAVPLVDKLFWQKALPMSVTWGFRRFAAPENNAAYDAASRFAAHAIVEARLHDIHGCPEEEREHEPTQAQ